MKHQEAYSGDAAKKHEAVLELSQHHLDHPSQAFSRDLRQPDEATISEKRMVSSGLQKSYAKEVYDKDRNDSEPQSYPKSKPFSWERLWPYREPSLSSQQPYHGDEEAREAPEILRRGMDFSKGGTEDKGYSHVLRCGTEIRQETSRGQEHQQYWSLSEWLSEIEGTKTVRERKESSKDFADLSRGTESWECPPLMKYGSEAPILKTFYHRDERLLEKEQVKLEQETDHNRFYLRKEGTDPWKIDSAGRTRDWGERAQVLRSKPRIKSEAPMVKAHRQEGRFPFDQEKDCHCYRKIKIFRSLDLLSVGSKMSQFEGDLSERDNLWRQEGQEEDSQGPRRVLKRIVREKQHLDRHPKRGFQNFRSPDKAKEC